MAKPTLRQCKKEALEIINTHDNFMLLTSETEFMRGVFCQLSNEQILSMFLHVLTDRPILLMMASEIIPKIIDKHHPELKKMPKSMMMELGDSNIH